jgi:type VI secretion system protein ImpE
MGAKELFDAGNLQEAIAQLSQDVKARPQDLRSRIFLFELLCFTADFQRATRQLDALAQISGEVKVEMGVQIYRHVLQAESARGAFFNGERQPKFLSEPPPYTLLHVDAVKRLKENRLDEVERLLNESRRVREPLKGQVDGSQFADLTDCDDLLGPFLEVLVHSDYVWLPFERISQIEIQPPRTLRDLLWIPANVALDDQPLGEVFLPVLYYGSSEHPDDQVKLGRRTDWKSVGEEVFLGMGQRMLLIDGAERSLLEIRKIEFTPLS